MTSIRSHQTSTRDGPSTSATVLCCVICRETFVLDDDVGDWSGVNYVCDGCVDDAENINRMDALGEWQASATRCGAGCPGWAVFNGNDLQRCDECKRFSDDDEACAHARALYDAAMHVRAQHTAADRSIFRRAVVA